MSGPSTPSAAPLAPPGAKLSPPRVLLRDGLDALLTALAQRGYAVLGPTKRDGAIVLGEVERSSQLPVGFRDVQAPGSYRLERRDDDAVFGYVVGPQSFKQVFHVPKERLFQLRRKDKGFEAVPVRDAPARKVALFGARACEIAAMAIQDRVLGRGAVPDPRYVARRADVLVIAVACNEPGGTCFCTSMGTGPRPSEGFDLSLTEILPTATHPHRFVVTIGSEAGAEILDAVTREAAKEADLQAADALALRARGSMGRTMNTDGIKELLYQAAEHPRWDDVATRCLSCANCTMVCPTCFCSRVDDTTSLDGQTAERERSWDSCFSLDYSYMHGGVARGSVAARYRHFITHKLASWHDQFDSSGCVGCGRCLTWCPAAIDITEEVAAIRAAPMSSRPEEGS